MTARRLLASALLLLAVPCAHAETLVCTGITAIPYAISAPGAYCLAQDLATSQSGGGGIVINASNVVLDCNGFGISNTNDGNGDVGVATSGRSGVTVANCRVTGFNEGIVFGAKSATGTIRDNTVRNAAASGIVAWGRDVQILGNSVIDTKGGGTGLDYSHGIVVSAYAPGTPSRDMVVRGNRVVGLSGVANPYAISVVSSISPVIEDNHVGRIWPKSGGLGYGILVGSDATRGVVRNNVLTSSTAYPVAGIVGGDGSSTTLCSGNVVNGFRSSIEGCAVESNDVVN
jgi:hypothetical protein